MTPERRAALSFGVSALSSIALAIVYWHGGQPQAEGLLLAITSGGIGLGIVVWAKHYMDTGDIAEQRHELASSEEAVEEFTADFERGEAVLVRRRLLLRAAGAAVAAFGVALLFPIRSLGPRPGLDLKQTGFRNGRRVVTGEGEPVRPADLEPDSVITVWPEGDVGAADSPTLLIRTRTEQSFKPRRGREDWTVDGIVAYSKLCTHTGCPVGLYQADEGLLLCPCHQSTFDVLDGARPVFGPAARSLPQLPLVVDDEGYLMSTADFSDPVGPGFWDRGR